MPFENIADMLERPLPPPAAHLKRDHLWEIFCPPRVGPVVRRLGGRSTRSVDLKTFWNLADPEIQQQLLTDVISLRPYCLLLSPPCTCFSTLMFSNWGRMDVTKREANLQEAIAFLDLAIWLCELQETLKAYYILEHLATALSWKRRNALVSACSRGFAGLLFIVQPSLAQVASLRGSRARFDQCRFGLQSKKDGKATQKPTILCTNMPAVFQAFNGKSCLGDHTHSPIQGSEGGMRRSTWAAQYPQPLCEAIAHAVLEQWDKDH